MRPLPLPLALPPLQGSRVQRLWPWALVVALGGMGLLWWFWPWLRPLPGAVPSSPSPRPRPDVITVFVEDHQRTIAALRLWRQRPGSLLLLQGQPSSQAASRAYIHNQNQWPADERGMVVLTPGCDTVGQVSTLARWLGHLPRPGRLTVVTSPAHLERARAITTIVLGAKGWQIEGIAVKTGDNRPETIWRLYRDQLRAQLVRATGGAGVKDLRCEVPAE